MPHGVLFRGGAEASIRRGLVEAGLLEAVIGLPGNLFYSTSIPACILVFRSTMAKDRKDHVLFLDGSAQSTKGRNQNSMSNSDVDAILDAYQLGGASELISRRLVPVSEIKLNSWDLNIGRYLRVATQAEVDVPAALAELATAQTELREAEARLAQQLKA